MANRTKDSDVAQYPVAPMNLAKPTFVTGKRSIQEETVQLCGILVPSTRRMGVCASNDPGLLSRLLSRSNVRKIVNVIDVTDDFLAYVTYHTDAYLQNVREWSLQNNLLPEL